LDRLDAKDIAQTRTKVDKANEVVWEIVNAGGDIDDAPATERQVLRHHDPESLDAAAEVAAKRRRGEDTETKVNIYRHLIETADLHPKGFVEMELPKSRIPLSPDDYAFLQDIQDKLRAGGETAERTSVFMRNLNRKFDAAASNSRIDTAETYHRYVNAVRNLESLLGRHATETDMAAVAEAFEQEAVKRFDFDVEVVARLIQKALGGTLGLDFDGTMTAQTEKRYLKTELERFLSLIYDTKDKFEFEHQELKDVPEFRNGVSENLIQWNDWAGEFIRSNSSVIESAAKEFDIDPNLVKAFIYTEKARGWYDVINPFTTTELPGNLKEKWEVLIPGSDVHHERDNIRLTAKLISEIAERLDDPYPEDIYSLYNGLAHDRTYQNAELTNTPYFMKMVYLTKAWGHDGWKLDKAVEPKYLWT
jgi:hypothetical protein